MKKFLSYFHPILMYHKVDKNSQQSKLSVSPRSFEKHLDWLKNHPICLLRDFAFQNKQIVLTFDDGDRSCYTEAFPLLERRSLKATFFIILDKVGHEGYMSKDQLMELMRSGHEIASHTFSHAWLPELSPDKMKYEIVDSKKALEDLLGNEVKTIAYPMGGFDERSIELVQEAGYRYACATNPPKRFDWKNPFCLKRIKVSRTADNFLSFKLRTSGYYSSLFERKR